MIKYIIRKWIKDYQNVTDRNVRQAYLVLSGTLGILCNLLLFVTKLVIGFYINSIAVISDAFNNMTDLGSSLVTILGAKLANRPADEEHPYGHGRFEYIAALVVAFIIFSVGFQLLRSSYDKLVNPEEVAFSTAILVILILTVLVKLWMFAYNSYIATTINSSINKANAYDSLNDCLATSLVIVSMVAGRYTDFPVDGLAGIFISLFIIYAGFSIAKDTVNLLLGSAPDPELVERINQLVCSGDCVVGTHDLEVHDYGPSRVIASIHAEVPDYEHIVEVHAVIDSLEKKIKEDLNINIIIHMDPISTDQSKIESVRSEVLSCINEEELGIKIRNFRIAQAENKVNVIFDLEIVAPIQKSEYAGIKKQVRDKIQSQHSGYEVIINEVGHDSELNLNKQVNNSFYK
ncbi:MAG: cation transporter [Syntrophomonadaceae bacterium]|nr:cation transporter [Syntrophomonadaceae bacterium]